MLKGHSIRKVKNHCSLSKQITGRKRGMRLPGVGGNINFTYILESDGA